MQKFKVGDKVRRTAHLNSGSWLKFLDAQRHTEFEVTKVHPDGDCLQINGWVNGFDLYPFSSEHFELAPQAFAAQPRKAVDLIPVTDTVNSPQHYQFFPDLEAIVVIARSMTQEQFYGYCLGNRLKYRLRAGNKDKLEQDIAKSDKYLELYEQHKGECIDTE